MMLTYGSLFTGVGGFDLGFENAGMECLWQCDLFNPDGIDDVVAEFKRKEQEIFFILDDEERSKALKKLKAWWANLKTQGVGIKSVLDKRWPEVKKINGVQNVSSKNLQSVDLICGGFPCQDLSVAGRRKGLDGERSGLWFEFHRIIADLKPRWVLIENVPGLLSSNGGVDFAIILRGLAECGYNASWRVLDSQYFGLAQRRKRVFIVASLGSGDCAQVLFESKSVSGHIETRRETGANTPAYAVRSAQTGSNGWGVSEDVTHTLDGTSSVDAVAFGGGNTQGEISVATSCNTNERYDFDTETFVAQTLQKGGSGGGWDSEPGDQMVAGIWAATTPDGVRESAGNLAPTLPARMGTGGHNVPFVGVRRLTPTECERLQGFPDGWTAGQSDTQRYRQMGNAVSVPVAEWIGRRIVKAETT